MGYIQERKGNNIRQEKADRVNQQEEQIVLLNGICPYFTMFPLDFPLSILRGHAKRDDRVLDPFCGRGTTNFAARLAGLDSLGLDSSSIAVAITEAKLVATTIEEILEEAEEALTVEATDVPKGEFWNWAFHPEVLQSLCKLRQVLLYDCTTATRKALRGIILGALHGPKQKTVASYFSNQCPRTYAPKPGYATRFWKNRGLYPESHDILKIIARRAHRYYRNWWPSMGAVRLADSRFQGPYDLPDPDKSFDWVITSPPYYGMRTYIPDQWLRSWFLGGPETVEYVNKDQVAHSSPEEFAADLRKVWQNVADSTSLTAHLVVRFGGISDRQADPFSLLKHSFLDSGWHIARVLTAGSAREGRRQADSFLRTRRSPLAEYDVWASKV